MEQNRKLPALLLAGFFGILTAYIISIALYRDEIHSLFEWAGALSLLTLGFGAFYFTILPVVWQRFNGVSTGAKIWGVILSFSSAIAFGLGSNILLALPFMLVGLALVSFTLTSLHELLIEKHILRFVTAWALSAATSFFTGGFLNNFYPGFFAFVVLTVLFNVFLTVVFEKILEQGTRSWKNNPGETIIPILVLALGLAAIVSTAVLLTGFPSFFRSSFFLPSAAFIPVFFGLMALGQGLASVLLQKLRPYEWQTYPFLGWIRRNLPGLLLAFTVPVATFLLATALVRDDVAFMDIFFQMDSPWWMNFLTGKADEILTMRAVHPFVLLILRPPTWFISLLLNGDKYHAPLILSAVAGGVCIFLAWLFFKKRTGSTTYALLMAALLGFSNSHLMLSVFLESYIFSAAALITFILLLQAEESRFSHLVVTGLFTFGITITNFAQACIGFFVMRRDRKEIFKYILVVLAVAVLLAFVQNVLFPTSDPFFVPSRFRSETPNINLNKYSDMTRDDIIKDLVSRVNITFRNTTLFSVVAPRPLVRYEETHCMPLCFRVIERFRGEFKYASYVGFGSLLARTWFLGLIIAVVLYLWSSFKSPTRAALQTVLLLNILFNFVLHIMYGEDPLLYTPNWTYALVFFFGISFERAAHKKWWQLTLLVFLIALLVNNLSIFRRIFETMLPIFS
jgi:hypothetical protein